MTLKLWGTIAGGLAILGILWTINHWRVEAGKVPGLKDEVKLYKDALKIQSERYVAALKPATEANDYDYKKTSNSLTLCLNQLRKSSTCYPVYPARTPNGAETTSQQRASGITDSAIVANNISCQADRDSLNAAKIWAVGYEKYKNNLNNQ